MVLNLNLAIEDFRPSADLAETLIEALSKISEVVSLSILVLFCVLVWATSHMFRYLNFKFAEFANSCSSSLDLLNSLDLVESELEKWRRHHSLVCQLVEQINSCFGIILLVGVIHSFVSFITDSFEITAIMALSSNKSLQTHFLIRFSQHFLLLSLVCLGSHYLQSEVRSLHNNKFYSKYKYT